ncbi:tRNA adenosine(34) deaminase TadA [Colwellia sp. TT2012]|uniref:tRNA adenosine(34) deaminase TadA n=1 Tax=Colwellia sp. TT2012 TaxID=1720342 RepID=UPI00070BA620|nr:tRNA adenosine(34) deaminase TadA [Colwellia sp. TT2012]
MTLAPSSSAQLNQAVQQRQLDLSFMQRAFELAQQAEQHDEIPVGAVVVYQGKIIAEGFNQSIMLNDPSSHAEMNAIRQAGTFLNNYRLLDCTLYVTLEPCPMCAGLLVHSRIKRLVYACSDLKTGAAGSAFNLVNNPQLNHQLAVSPDIMQEECSQLLSAFFKRRRKEKKQAKKATDKASL